MPNLHFLNFLRPVATVTDKLIRDTGTDAAFAS